MKKLAILLSLLIAGAATAATQTPAKQSERPTKQLAGLVVATDSIGKTITIQKENADGMALADGGATTLPVDSEALPALKTVSPGEKVKLVCRVNDIGVETAVTAIQKAEKPKKTPDER